MQPMPTPPAPDPTDPSAAFPPLDLGTPAPRGPVDGAVPTDATDEFPVIGRDDPDPPPAPGAAAWTVAPAGTRPEPGVDPDAHPETVVEPDGPPEPETAAEPAVEAEPAPVDAPRHDEEEARANASHDGGAGAPRDGAGRDADDEDGASEVTAHGDAGELFDSAEYLDDEEDQPDEDLDDGAPEGDAESEDVEERPDQDRLIASGEAALPLLAPGVAATAAHPRLRPGDVAQAPIAVWTPERAQSYREQWHAVQARFVDEPEEAVAAAQALVTDAVHALAEALLAQQVGLDPRRHSLSPDTETLRVAMRRYREFLDRVLAL